MPMAFTFARIQPREEELRKSLYLVLGFLTHITFNTCTQRNYIIRSSIKFLP